jgi:ferredoxin-thioredoxin reductase catalytic subunit
MTERKSYTICSGRSRSQGVSFQQGQGAVLELLEALLVNRRRYGYRAVVQARLR